MYNKNDYRYYLENRLAHSNDYLAHYGVKGMKWKQHLKRSVKSVKEFIRPSVQVSFDEAVVEPKKAPSGSKSVIDGYQARGKRRTAKERVKVEQARGKRRTAKERVKVEQARGKNRTAAIKNRSSEYYKESDYNKKKNRHTIANRVRRHLKKTQKIQVIDRVDQKTGKHF